MYMGWFDNSRRKAVQLKLSEGVDRYRETRGREPTQILMHPDDYDALPEMALRDLAEPSSRLQRNVFFIGDADDPGIATPPLSIPMR